MTRATALWSVFFVDNIRPGVHQRMPPDTKAKALEACDRFNSRGIRSWVAHMDTGEVIKSNHLQLLDNLASTLEKMRTPKPRHVHIHPQITATTHSYWVHPDFKTHIRQNGNPVRAELTIEYVSSEGEITCRPICIESVLLLESECFILAFCKLRTEYRTFKVSKIKKATDEGKNEIVKNIREWLSKLPSRATL